MRDHTPFHLTIEKREHYVYVVYGGHPLTLEMILETINRVAGCIRAGAYDRVLLVRDAPLLESDENRAMVAGMIRSLLGTGIRFAIVDAFDNDPDEVRRAVDASRRAGWDLTGFNTVDEAECWLRSGQSDLVGISPDEYR